MMKTLDDRVDKSLRQIEGFNRDIVLSAPPPRISRSGKFKHANPISMETIPIALELEKRGINVLLTSAPWARDQFSFNNDGSFTYIPTAIEEEQSPHEAHHGGANLINKVFNDGILITTDHAPELKRQETKKVLGIKKAIYADIDNLVYDFSEYLVDGNQEFYSSNLKHIDPYFNLCQREKLVVSYGTGRSVKLAKEIAKEIGYDVLVLPREDARYAGIGFLEVGDHVVVDCRAEATMKKLEEVGYHTIPTPVPMRTTNRKNGSIRCVSNEAPPVIEKLNAYTEINFYLGLTYQDSLFSRTNGKAIDITNPDENFEASFYLK